MSFFRIVKYCNVWSVTPAFQSLPFLPLVFNFMAATVVSYEDSRFVTPAFVEFFFSQYLRCYGNKTSLAFLHACLLNKFVYMRATRVRALLEECALKRRGFPVIIKHKYTAHTHTGLACVPARSMFVCLFYQGAGRPNLGSLWERKSPESGPLSVRARC